MALRRQGGGPSGQADAVALFSVMWALAAAWHVLGNPTAAPGWAQALVAVGVGLVLLHPGAPVPLAVLAAAGILTMWEEAPFVGNHWVLSGLVDLAVLLAVATGAVRRRLHDRIDLADRLFPAARLSLLAFYCFAAFAKLNEDFFDRSVSCAAFFLQESTDSIGLSSLDLGGNAWLQQATIFATVGIELSVPILLVRRSTRRLGVIVALAFHTILAIDHTHQFFDFSAVLFALFVLFLPPKAGTWVAERAGSVRARLALRDERLPERLHLALAAVPVTAVLLVALDVLSRRQALVVGWWPWQAYAVIAIITTSRFLRQDRALAVCRLLPHHVLFAIVPLLVVLNGLTPYLELKTGYAWNMYANLRTVDGDSNHLIVRRTFPLTDEQSDLVEILDTDSADLAYYKAHEYALTWRQLRIYLAAHPDVRIRYRRGAAVVALRHAADRPSLVEPLPLWREKLQLFRAVDLRQPERCLTAFGPAR